MIPIPTDWAYKHTVLALCTFAFFATMVARLVISPVVPAITAHFQINNTVIGIALSGMWLAYATTQFPSGILGDRFGERAIILASIGGTTLVSLLLALSPVFPVFVLFTLVLGAVAGLHYSVATTLLGRVHDDLGFAIGVHAIGSSAAGLAAPVLAVWVGTQYGWRAALATGALVAGPILVLVYWRIRPMEPLRPTQPLRERFELAPLLRVLRRPAIAFTTVIAAMTAFSWQGLASFLPAFLVAYRGQSEAVAGVVFAGYFVVQTVAKPGVGSLGDRFGRDPVMVGCLAVAIAGLGSLVLVSGRVGMLVGTAAVGVGLTLAVVVEPRFMDNLGERERGAGFGLVRSIYMLVGSLGSVTLGFFSDQFGWPVAFGVLVAIMTVVGLTVLANELFDLGI